MLPDARSITSPAEDSMRTPCAPETLDLPADDSETAPAELLSFNSSVPAIETVVDSKLIESDAVAVTEPFILLMLTD